MELRRVFAQLSSIQASEERQNHLTDLRLEQRICAEKVGSATQKISALDNLTFENNDQEHGINIVKVAIESPLRTIVNNAGGEGSVVINKVKEGSADFGYNAKTNHYENLIETGVIDPVKVTRLALENAASISGLLLTTECVITDTPEDQNDMGAGMPAGGGMPGMM